MTKPRILRKRYIPDEVVDISGDEILQLDENIMITKWDVIHPRNDISGGISFAFFQKGFKISRFMDKNGQFAYWYCDIIEVEYDEDTNTYTFVDLLVDVKILPDGQVMILDLDELAEAVEKSIITQKQACDALLKLDNLLKEIYQGDFPSKLISQYGIQC